MFQDSPGNLVLFAPTQHSMCYSLSQHLGAEVGEIEHRQFPDGETYLRVLNNVKGKKCVILLDLVNPNPKYLPLIFLSNTLRDLGAESVGLVAPYLSYMRQDKRFNEGEAVSSRIFAKALSHHVDWMVTVDPHLHRFASLDEIYSIPTVVVQAAPAIAEWLKGESEVMLVGPDAESQQWVEQIASISEHPFIIGEKKREGDREVHITFEAIENNLPKKVVIIDDVISSGHTILQCVNELKTLGVQNISCATVHGIFAEDADSMLILSGLTELVTCNTVAHHSNRIDVSRFIADAVYQCL
ncbi:ribose-phosphate diphosphokinase [Paraneptunicella aestuarii]|uniref:ribose-phosphate diphosphokinase n=1 Tax=Paraneptunicella aestuarii TaxID=2831148 RepID=UPI001E4D19CE|nr:ribose-phosphate diphosphokinase [Paraneptunicella aestuarii]UAA40599.1 ribose-phosphate diphosphokinase [Paraneptunicella aestuarii]